MATGIPAKRRSKPQAGSITLSYEGKRGRDEILALAAPVLRFVGGDHGPNRLYFGDNLAVMLGLLRDREVAGHVRCIYVDPPYGNESDFVTRSSVAAYSDHLSGGEYVEFLRQRLVVARELLADDGTIFVHLDQKRVFEIKLIMDEVFGADNFRNFITRKKCNTKNYTKRTFGGIADHILFYSKTANYVWNRPVAPWPDEEKIAKEYQYQDSTGKRFKKVPVHAPGKRNGATGQPWRGRLPPEGKHWQYPPDRLDEMDRNGEIYWSATGNPRRIVYFDASSGLPIQDIWMDLKDAHNQNIKITGYPTEKNFDLVKRIVEATSNEGDLVMDFFCGSGTTLEAAHVGGRRFIGIDASPIAITTTIKRLLHGRQAMGDFVSRPATKAPSSLGLESPMFGLYSDERTEIDMATRNLI